MLYPVNEIFYSIQGEGFHSGKAAVFIRLSGCNLKCPWCDTDHTKKYSMSEIDISKRVEQLSGKMEMPFVVITGGEPTIHNLYHLCNQLKKNNRKTYIAIETNGTNPERLLPLVQTDLLNWITVSPKYQTPLKSKFKAGLVEANEIKIVLDSKIDPLQFEPILINKFKEGRCFIQPCSGRFREAVDFVLRRPKWRLSIQTQKIVNIR